MKASTTMWLKNKVIPKLLPIILIGTVIYCYHALFRTFYQQDEWVGVGDVISYGSTRFLGKFPIINILAGSGRIMGSIFNYLFYQYFTFQTWPFALFSLAVHSINSILIYIVVEKFSRNNLLAFLTSIVFICLYTPIQAITWFAANTTTLPSTTFVLISIFLMQKYMESLEFKLLIYSQIAAIIGYLFKESGVVIFLILPILYIMGKQKKPSLINVIKKFMLLEIYLFFCLIVVTRNYISLPVNSGAFLAHTQYMRETMLFNALLYPLISLSQIFVPDIYLYRFATFFQTVMYPFVNGNIMASSIRDNITSDVISLYLSFIIIISSVFLALLSKKFKKIILYSLGFTVISFLPYIILRRGGSYLDSRYFYMGSVGGALLYSSIIGALLERFLFNKKLYSCLIVGVGVVVCGFIYMNMRLIHRDIKVQADISTERLQVLRQFKQLYPVFPNKPIVYVSGDNNGYYGQTNVKVPFQQGVGYTLMIWYYRTGIIPKEFFLNDYLWNIRDQGYREIQGKGFGYFWDKNDLLRLFKQDSKLSENQIVAFYYKSNDRTLFDISPEIRDYIRMNRVNSL